MKQLEKEIALKDNRIEKFLLEAKNRDKQVKMVGGNLKAVQDKRVQSRR